LLEILMVRPKGGPGILNRRCRRSVNNAKCDHDVIDGPYARLWPELQRSWHQQGGLRDDAIGILHPCAHPTPCVARIDHFLHLEPVERP